MKHANWVAAKSAVDAASRKVWNDGRRVTDPLMEAARVADEAVVRYWPLHTMAVEVRGDAFTMYTGYHFIDGERRGSGELLPESRDLLAVAALRHVHFLWMAGDLAELPPSGSFSEVVAWCAQRGVRNLQRAGF